MNIIALGPKGTNGHFVAHKVRSGSRLRITYAHTNEGVLNGVVRGPAVMGVVPVENGYEGWVREVIRFWLNARRRPVVIGEVHVPIVHQLLVHPDVEDIRQVTAVVSHPQAIGQCVASLRKLRIKETITDKSTALAARKVSKKELPLHVAALAAPMAAEVYGLRVLKEHMEDDRGNMTRFHIISRQAVPVDTGNDKTAMIFFTENKPRRLFNALSCICMGEANMSTIHSIPLGEIGKFAFYVEFDGHAKYGEGRRIVRRLETVTEKMILLGSFPKEVLP